MNSIQLTDAAGEEGDWTFEETTQRRLLPGDGDLDLAGLVRIIDDMGVTAPSSVEVLNLSQWAKPLDVQASESFAATRALLDKARS